MTSRFEIVQTDADQPFFTIDGTPASPMLYPVDERAEATP
jgi:hypothetical protein